MEVPKRLRIPLRLNDGLGVKPHRPHLEFNQDNDAWRKNNGVQALAEAQERGF